MDRADLQRVAGDGWIRFLEAQNSTYAVDALRRDLESVRSAVAAIRDDATTPDTRLSDDVLARNPVAIGSLTELMLGGLPTGNSRPTLHARLRYFDPDARRPGLPRDVAALVDELTPDQVGVTLVNLSPTTPRRVVVQGGAYGEHRIRSVALGEVEVPIDGTSFPVRLAPGAGARLEIRTDRYAAPPSLSLPWDRP